jgi:hypothetical protein
MPGQTALVSVEQIVLFLKNEEANTENTQLIEACETNAEAEASNYIQKPDLSAYEPDTLPQDLRAAIIKLSCAEFIAATTNVNFVEGDGTFVDRASRLRKEAYKLLDKYRPINVY